MPFVHPTYPVTCPQCGGQLTPVALDAQTAPWLCQICSLGFWSTELATTNRSNWNGRIRGFPHGPHMDAINSGVASEWTQSQGRGTSLRADQIVLASADVLQSALLTPGIDPTFASLIEEQLLNMGVS